MEGVRTMKDASILDWASHPLVAGVVGSLVSLRFVPGLTLTERLMNLAAGSALAYYTAPAIVSWWGMSENLLGFFGFAIGMFGLSASAAVLQGIRETNFAEILRGWLSRKG